MSKNPVTGMSEEELIKKIDKGHQLINTTASRNDLYGILGIYQEELQRKVMEKNIEATERLIEAQDKNRKQTKIFSWISFVLSITMIALAIITIIYASKDSKFDRDWMKDQKELLMKIDTSINDLDKPVYVVLEADSTMSNMIKH